MLPSGRPFERFWALTISSTRCNAKKRARHIPCFRRTIHIKDTILPP
jgi:hypothetical protein